MRPSPTVSTACACFWVLWLNLTCHENCAPPPIHALFAPRRWHAVKPILKRWCDFFFTALSTSSSVVCWWSLCVCVCLHTVVGMFRRVSGSSTLHLSEVGLPKWTVGSSWNLHVWLIDWYEANLNNNMKTGCIPSSFPVPGFSLCGTSWNRAITDVISYTYAFPGLTWLQSVNSESIKSLK